MIKNLVLLTFILLSFVCGTKANAEDGGRPWEKKLYLGASYGMGRVNMHGQDAVPTYNGQNYSGEMEYKIGGEISVGIYANFIMGSYKNSENSATQSENLSFNAYHGGLKLYYYDLYFKVGYGHIQGSDESKGDVVKTIDFSNDSYNAGIGVSFALSKNIDLNVGVETIYSTFDPSFRGFSEKTTLVNYTAIIGLSFVLPSQSYEAPSN